MKKIELSNKKYKILNYVPLIAMALFTVLMGILIFKAPVAKIDAFDLNEKFGTIFSGKRFDEISGLSLLSLVLIITYLLMIIYLIGGLLINKVGYKYNKLFNKPYSRILEIISPIFALVFLVSSFIMIGQINRVDLGLNIIKVGLYPILSIILSLINLIAVVGALVLCHLHEKDNPEIRNNWEEERKKALENKGYTSNSKKQSKSKNARLLAVIIVAVVLITLYSSRTGETSIFERVKDSTSFKATSLKKYVSGNNTFTPGNIEFIIGKPDVEPEEIPTEGTYEVRYYTNEYSKLNDKTERLEKYLLLAIKNADRTRASKILKQYQKNELEKETLVYGEAKITYEVRSANRYPVYLQKVVYNSFVAEGISSVAKEVKSVKILNLTSDYSSPNVSSIESIEYIATYTDGSFIYAESENVSVMKDGVASSTYEGSYVGQTFKWSDEFGTYEVVATSLN